MHRLLKCFAGLLLCAALLVPFMSFGGDTVAEATNYGSYSTLAVVPNIGDCPSMQGLGLCGDYFYCVKTDGNDYAAAVCRVSKKDGSQSWLTNTGNSTNFFYDFGHGNDCEVLVIDGVTTMFIPTSQTGSGSLVRYTIDGTNATKLANYKMITPDGTLLGGGAIRVVRTDADNLYLLFKTGNELYTGILPKNQVKGNLVMEFLCEVDHSQVVINGQVMDTSDWVLQGFGYRDHMLYLPITGVHDTAYYNVSLIAVYDLQGASGVIKPLPDPTFKIVSSDYSNLFEMESCLIDPLTGILYFNTNRRKSASDANHDGIHYITGWTYQPQNRRENAGNYRWEMKDGRFVSVTQDGNEFNGLAMHQGSITGTTLTNAAFATDKTVVLRHDAPWVVEWKSGMCTAGELLFSTQAVSTVEEQTYVYVNGKNSRISLGVRSGSKYHNYGVTLADHGVDGTTAQVFRLTNKINADGSNMVYLSVDGKELGPLNHYYVGTTYQNTTSNWVSGKDFRFSYLGTPNHPLNDSLEYIQVWGNGIGEDAADQYRWQTSGNALTPIQQSGFTVNDVETLEGSISGTSFTDVRYGLEQNVMLRHDRAWSIEFAGSYSAGSMMLAEDNMGYTRDAAFLFRSSIMAFGFRGDGVFHNYGLKLADYGIDFKARHVYRLENRVNADGSNMVYLLVDGAEVGPMNQYFRGTSAQGTTSDWLNGKDFTFSYVGSYRFGVEGSIEYIQIQEDCVHSYGGWSVISQASCTEGGIQERVCGLCGDKQAEEIVPSGHDWSVTTIEGNCVTYPCQESVCGNCGEHTYDYPDSLLSGWMENLPAGTDMTRVETMVQYRFRNQITTTSYSTSLPGYTQQGYTPVKTGSGSLLYVPRWGAGFDTGNALYSQYNKSAVAAGETATTLTVVDHDYVEGYLYYHWCYSGKVDSRESKEGSYVNFHAYYSTVAPEYFTYDSADGSYGTYHPGCSNSNWYWPLEVRYQSYTNYNKLYTYVGWDSWSDWSDQAVEACDTCQVEQRTLYRYVTASLEGHQFQNGSCAVCGAPCAHDYLETVVTPDCTNKGYTRHDCSICGYSYESDIVGALGHSYENGVCDRCGVACTHQWKNGICSVCGVTCGHQWSNHLCGVCGVAYPQRDYYLFGFINGSNYACEEDALNQGIYKFENGKLTVFFTQDSYVAVKAEGNQDWYMAYMYHDGSITAATLYNTKQGAAEKLFVPGGKRVTLTLIDNGDDSFMLSYKAVDCTHEIHDEDGLCVYCGAFTGHQYINGVCGGCGGRDPSSGIVDPSIAIDHPSLSFESEILYNFYFTAGDLTDVVEMGLITFTTQQTDGTVATADKVYPGYSSVGGGMYMVQTEGVSAKNLGDAVYVKVYAKLTNGSYVYTDMVGYNAAAYAKSILKNSTNAYMKQLVVAMMNYGTEAQMYFGHNTSNPMNSFLTDAQKALVQEYNTGMVNGVTAVDSTKAGSLVYNGSSFTKRAPSVSFDGAFSINYYFTTANKPDGEVKLYYWTLEDYNAATQLSPRNATGSMSMTNISGNQYWGQVSGIAAKELDETVFVLGVYAYNGTTYTTGVLNYHIGKYCTTLAAKDTSEQQELAKATAVYGYYAKEYFSNI